MEPCPVSASPDGAAPGGGLGVRAGILAIGDERAGCAAAALLARMGGRVLPPEQYPAAFRRRPTLRPVNLPILARPGALARVAASSTCRTGAGFPIVGEGQDGPDADTSGVDPAFDPRPGCACRVEREQFGQLPFHLRHSAAESQPLSWAR